MEVPRLEVESELQLLAYTTATATSDPSHICDLHCSSRQHWISHPLIGARDQTPALMDTSWGCYCWATMGTPSLRYFLNFHFDFSFSPWVHWKMLLSFQILGSFLVIFLSLSSNVIIQKAKDVLWIISIKWNLLIHSLWPRICSILVNVPHALEKNEYSLCIS